MTKCYASTHTELRLCRSQAEARRVCAAAYEGGFVYLACEMAGGDLVPAGKPFMRVAEGGRVVWRVGRSC